MTDYPTKSLFLAPLARVRAALSKERTRRRRVRMFMLVLSVLDEMEAEHRRALRDGERKTR